VLLRRLAIPLQALLGRAGHRQPQEAPEVARRNDTAGVERRTKSQKAYVLRQKTDGACTDCGGNSGAEHMQFDHIPGRGEKIAAISDLLGKWTSWTRLLAEIAKCDLVCTECHQRRTLQRRGKVFVRLSEADCAAIRRKRAAGRRTRRWPLSTACPRPASAPSPGQQRD
jgi:hypothetical protein